ncbi:MAG: thioredoxin family protein [Candidatus Sericytochromatia bacterium]|nr:thioredoxin family protein [Candidatus Sericytochromatia bacterium]
MFHKKTLTLTLLSASLLLASGTQAFADHHQESKTKASDKKAQSKPIVAVIKASWCPACQKISSTVQAVMKEHGDQAQWVVFDISDKESSKAAQAKAKELGLESFFKEYGAKTATVAILHPETKKVLKVLMAEGKKEKYAEALQAARKAI